MVVAAMDPITSFCLSCIVGYSSFFLCVFIGGDSTTFMQTLSSYKTFVLSCNGSFIFNLKTFSQKKKKKR